MGDLMSTALKIKVGPNVLVNAFSLIFLHKFICIKQYEIIKHLGGC
jgi:hypothetical protein